MKSNKIKIDPKVLEDFESCLDTKRYSHTLELSEEELTLMREVYAKATCNRKLFVEKFRERFGRGSTSRMAAWCERYGIKVEKGKN